MAGAGSRIECAGVLGSAIATGLLGTGFEVRVWNRTPGGPACLYDMYDGSAAHRGA